MARPGRGSTLIIHPVCGKSRDEFWPVGNDNLALVCYGEDALNDRPTGYARLSVLVPGTRFRTCQCLCHTLLGSHVSQPAQRPGTRFRRVTA